MKARTAMISILIFCALALLGACNGGGGATNSQPPPPPPASMTISAVFGPYGAGAQTGGGGTFAIAGQAGFQIGVGGSGFTSTTVVYWNGDPLPMEAYWQSATYMVADVSSSLIVKPGTAMIQAVDTSTGAKSNTVPFGIASPAAATAGVVQLVSIAMDGTPANGNSLVPPSVSATGRYIAFQDNATNLASGPSSSQYQQIYERDTCVGAPSGCTPSTTQISVTYDGSLPAGHSYDSAVSADGRYVAFDSVAPNILPNISPCGVAVSGPAQLSCVYLRDTCTDAPSGCSPSTTLISVGPDGSVFDGGLPSMSPDGRFVVFDSAGTGPGINEVYLRDTCIGAPSGCTPSTVLASAAADGSPGNQNSLPQSVSSTGRYVAFASWASNLPQAGSYTPYIYVRDTCIGAPSGCVPETTNLDPGGSAGLGEPGASNTVVPGISADGGFAAFSTNTVGLVSQNVQGWANVYLADTCAGVTSGCTPSLALASIGNDGSIGNSVSKVDGRQTISADGRFVIFESLASNMVPGYIFTAGSWEAVFVHDTCLGAPSGCVPSTVDLSVVDTPNIGIPAMAISDYGSISADGHYAVFLSSATNVSSPPGNGNLMVYLAKTGF